MIDNGEPGTEAGRMSLGVAEMVRYLIPALVVFNLVLFGRSMGWLPGLFGDIPDPGRISRQVNPEQIKILPGPPGQPIGNPPSRS